MAPVMGADGRVAPGPAQACAQIAEAAELLHDGRVHLAAQPVSQRVRQAVDTARQAGEGAFLTEHGAPEHVCQRACASRWGKVGADDAGVCQAGGQRLEVGGVARQKGAA